MSLFPLEAQLQKFSFEYEDAKRGGHLRRFENMAKDPTFDLDGHLAKLIAQNAFAIHEAFHELRAEVHDENSTVSQLFASIGWNETEEKEVLINYIEQVTQHSLESFKKRQVLSCKKVI
jgi:hypothetical protein